jgi:hypothetical protein
MWPWIWKQLIYLPKRRHNPEVHSPSTCRYRKPKPPICIHSLPNVFQTELKTRDRTMQRVLPILCFAGVFVVRQGNVSAPIGESTPDSSCTASCGHVTNDLPDITSRRLRPDLWYHFHSRHTLVRRQGTCSWEFLHPETTTLLPDN